MEQAKMNAMDAISGALASAYIILEDGNRYCFMQMKNFESNMEINTTEVAILGQTGKGNKPNGWTGTWKATAYYNQSIIRKMLLEYKNTGKLMHFDIQVSNEDEGSVAGRQTTILKKCLVKGGVLAKFDADSNILEEDIEGTYDDFELPESFHLLPGMQA